MIILWDFIPDPLTLIQARSSPTCPVLPPFAATLTWVPCLLSGITTRRDHPGMQQQQQRRLWQQSFEPVFWVKSPPKKAAEREGSELGMQAGCRQPLLTLLGAAGRTPTWSTTPLQF